MSALQHRQLLFFWGLVLLPVHGRRRQLLRSGVVVSGRLSLSGGALLSGRHQHMLGMPDAFKFAGGEHGLN